VCYREAAMKWSWLIIAILLGIAVWTSYEGLQTLLMLADNDTYAPH
jgi:hypothetical protein